MTRDGWSTFVVPKDDFTVEEATAWVRQHIDPAAQVTAQQRDGLLAGCIMCPRGMAQFVVGPAYDTETLQVLKPASIKLGDLERAAKHFAGLPSDG